MKPYVRQLEELREQYHATVQALADKVRVHLVLPACRRRRLTFTSGMGDYFFSLPRTRHSPTYGEVDNIGSAEEARATPGCMGLARIFAVLDAEVEHGQPLGYWVCDVTEADLRSSR